MTAVSEIGAPVELAEIFAPVQKELDLVEARLRENLIDDNPFIKEVLAQIFLAGGKRVRPALALLCARATCNHGELGLSPITLAVLTELIHTASLVHDDVIDGSALRRGAETVNRKWNDRLAVLVGDLLFAEASICLAQLKHPEIVGIYGRVLGDLCAGEIRQMKQQFVCDVDWDAYIRKSYAKTASLFAAACKSAAILNGRSDAVITALGEYGANLGICFQLVDDLLDVTGTNKSLGKPAGSDLSAGIITAPVLFMLERRDARALKLEKLIKSREVCGPQGLAEALNMIKDGIQPCMDLCKSYAAVARHALALLDESAAAFSLHSLLDYLLVRSE